MSTIHVTTAYRADESAPLLVQVGEDAAPLPPPPSPGSRLFWRLGALYGAAGIALGAFGAHGLRKHTSDQHKLANFALAAQYQLIHSCVVLVASGNPIAATFFITGMTLFSGSIYALVLDSERFKIIGPVTPIGGVFLLAGWVALFFVGGARRPRVNIGWH